MASLETAAKGAIVDLADAAGAAPTPTTIAGMVGLFGGGKTGVSALAHAVAAERIAAGVKYKSTPKKSAEQHAYEAARRNIERYRTEKGAEKRTPKGLTKDLDKVANRAATRQATERIQRTARREGGVTVWFRGDVKISKDERPREFRVTLSAEDLDAFVREAQAHHWQAAADELNYALLDAWDEGRGGILGHDGVITSVDELTITYGG